MRIVRQPNGIKKLDFFFHSKRYRFSIGKVAMDLAHLYASNVTKLIEKHGSSPDDTMTLWLDNIDPKIRSKLVSAGLITNSSAYPGRLGEWWKYVVDNQYTGVKSSGTVTLYNQSKKKAIEFFASNARLESISKGKIEEFRVSLVRKGMATSTVGGHLRKLKTILNWAVQYELIDKNPFNTIKIDNKKDKENKVYVSSDKINKLLLVCDPYWQAAICLCRYAGMRFPSDVFGLEWDRVNFQNETIVIWRQKTQRDVLIPMTQPVKRTLGVLYDYADSGEFVFPDNMRAYLKYPARATSRLVAFIRKAGMEPWPVLTNSMRTSYGRDLADHGAPIQDIAKWMDHSVDVAIKNYQLPAEKQMKKVSKMELD